MRYFSPTFAAIVISFGLAACETPREKNEAAADASKAEVTVRAMIDTDTLLATVQTLRDREFKQAPAFEKVDKLPADTARGTDAYAAERALLTRVLFGKVDQSGVLPTLAERDIARYDAATHTITYVAHADSALLERALIFAIVDGLDRANFAPPVESSSWDEALARGAAQVGPGAFVWIANEAAERNVSPQVLAKRPEIAGLLNDVAPRLSVAASTAEALRPREGAFLIREGFALTAALFRGNEWSSGEFALIDPPTDSLWVVRPDRWLSGEGLGQWSFPAMSETPRHLADISMSKNGKVGPALTGMWLSNHLAPAVARSIYTSWQSDAYQYWGDEKRWAFRWVSAWKTPSDAQQVAGTLEAGFGKLPAHYEVVTSGTTVAVVASSAPDLNDHLQADASALAGMSPIYGPGKKRMVSYVPTPIDRYRDGLEDARLDLDEKTWVDPVAGITMDLKELSETWTIQKTESVSARWVARTEGRAILMTTELVDPFLPAFETPDFESTVVDNFKKSFQDAKVQVERIDDPLKGTIRIRVNGKLDGVPTTLELRLFRVGDVTVSYSVKAEAQKFDAALLDFEKTLKKMTVEPPDKAEDSQSRGVIEFKVED